MTEEVNTAAMQLALLELHLKKLDRATDDIEQLRNDFNSKSNVHMEYKVDLSVTHTDHLVSDFTEMNFEVYSLTITPLPSAMSIKLRGISDEPIELNTKEVLTITNHEVTRLLVTNEAGTGTAKIHVFGRHKVKTLRR